MTTNTPTTRTGRSALLALPLCLAFAAPADRVAFAPADGTELSKVFSSELSMQLDDFSLSVGGQELDSSMVGEFEINVDFASEIGIKDTYIEMGEGQPKKLERTFDSLNGSVSFNMSNDMFGNEDQSSELESELEGSTVVFTWDADEEAYTRAYKDDEGDEELLENLEEDMDLRVLLPDGEISVDDSWEVELSSLKGIVMPGGDVALVPDEEAEQPEMPDDMTDMVEGAVKDMMDELLGGSATCTYAGTREEGDVTVGVVKLALNIEGNTSVTDMIEQMMEAAREQQEEEMPDVDLTIEVADIEIGYEGTGSLLWNIENGHLHSFELSGEVFAAVDLSMSIDMGGQAMNQDISVEFSGTYGTAVETP